jgi:preprotein translocase subunit SecA
MPTPEEIAAAEEEARLATEDAKKQEKKFTQADVDRIVQREKAALKPLKEKLEAFETGANETLQAYEKVITQMVKDMSKEIHPSILKLMTKLTPLEQLEYLSDPENNAAFEKKEFPLPKKKVQGQPEFKPSEVEKFL